MDFNWRDIEPDHLHPTFRERLAALLAGLTAEGLPFLLFEGYRSPARQAFFYGKGRQGDHSPRVTNAKPWQSFHQYGLAADLALFEEGKWSWDNKGPRGGWWSKMHQLARAHGLEPLVFEGAHVQLRGQLLELLLLGHYPPGGDASWREHLIQEIQAWQGSPASPPAPHAMEAKEV